MAKQRRNKGNGTIAKVGNYFYLQSRLPDGRRQSQVLYHENGERCTSRTQAEAAALVIAEKKSQLNAIDTHEKYVEKIAEIRQLKAKLMISLVAAFEIAMAKPGNRRSSSEPNHAQRSYWLDFCQFMNDKHHITSIADVSSSHAEEYMIYLRTNGRWHKNVTYQRGNQTVTYQISGEIGNKTKNEILKCLRRVFRLLAKDLGYRAEDNPFFDIPLLPNDSQNREIFSDAELKRIFLKPPRLIRAMFTTGLCTGMREGDCATLRWKEVVPHSGEMTYRNGKPDFLQCEVKRIMLKTGRLVIIPILEEFAEFLSEQWMLCKDAEYITPEAAALYYQKDTADRKTSELSKKIICYLQSIGIQTCVEVKGRSRKTSVKDFHSIRHNFCTYAYLSGVDPITIQKIVGHTDIRMTMRYLDHLDRENTRKALKKMRGLFSFHTCKEMKAEISDWTEMMKKRIDEFKELATDEELLAMNQWINKLKGKEEELKLPETEPEVQVFPEPLPSIVMEAATIPVPDPVALKILIHKYNYTRVARIYDVSETTIRKWLKKYEITPPAGFRWNGKVSPEVLEETRRILNDFHDRPLLLEKLLGAC